VIGSQQIGEERSVPAIGLVGTALHAVHVPGMGQADLPAGEGDEFRSEVGGSAAGFQGDTGGLSQQTDRRGDPLHVVGLVAVEQHLFVRFHDAHANGVFVIVEADEEG
jgi:hypothetical protein